MPPSTASRPGVIGTRNMKKALLRALLEPTAQLRQLENDGDYTARLALLEEQKSLPVAGHLGDVLSESRHAGGAASGWTAYGLMRMRF
ncbi:L-rhamnose isomerase [Klebsiella pneumoniae subsp. rhinoscleromatis]|nr:L-rhamnose isomerase [Klebsiella pneumoniae subsp. rhinoscleromatis]